MDLAAMLEVATGLAGLILGSVIGALLMRRHERRGYLPKSVLAPVPVAADDHRHEWNTKPYLHDPALPAWLYSCVHKGCPKVLRSAKEL